MQFDGQFIVGILSLLVAAYGVFHQRKQTKMIEIRGLTQTRPEKRRGEIPRLYWWKTSSVYVLVVLAGLAWWPWLSDQFSEPIRPIATWGAHKAIVDQKSGNFIEMSLYISLNVGQFKRYADAYNIMGVACHYLSDRDIDDMSELEKSNIYRIRNNNQTIIIPASTRYVMEVNNGWHNTNYFILLLPNDIKPDAFDTFRQAKQMGIKVIPVGFGPP